MNVFRIDERIWRQQLWGLPDISIVSFQCPVLVTLGLVSFVLWWSLKSAQLFNCFCSLLPAFTVAVMILPYGGAKNKFLAAACAYSVSLIIGIQSILLSSLPHPISLGICCCPPFRILNGQCFGGGTVAGFSVGRGWALPVFLIHCSPGRQAYQLLTSVHSMLGNAYLLSSIKSLISVAQIYTLCKLFFSVRTSIASRLKSHAFFI